MTKFAIAYALHKVFLPVRLLGTASITPRLYMYTSRWKLFGSAGSAGGVKEAVKRL
jgi:hypothetical protein